MVPGRLGYERLRASIPERHRVPGRRRGRAARAGRAVAAGVRWSMRRAARCRPN